MALGLFFFFFPGPTSFLSPQAAHLARSLSPLFFSPFTVFLLLAGEKQRPHAHGVGVEQMATVQPRLSIYLASSRPLQNPSSIPIFPSSRRATIPPPSPPLFRHGAQIRLCPIPFVVAVDVVVTPAV